jgi:hypothetical protein
MNDSIGRMDQTLKELVNSYVIEFMNEWISQSIKKKYKIKQ